MRLRIVRVQMLKELDQFRKDRLTVALAFALPVAALLMYGLATRLEATDMPVSVINQDYGKASRDFVDRLYAGLQLIPADSRSNLIEPLDRSEVKAALIIPPDFSRNIAAHRPATYEALVDGSDVNNARVVKNDLIAITQNFQRYNALRTTPPPIQPVVRLWYNPGRKEALYIVPGAIALVLWIFPALLSTLSLAREKEQGTILQVYASNLTAAEFIGGKAAAYTLVALGEFACLIAVAVTVFRLTFNAEIITFLVCTVLYTAAGVLFGLFAATKAETQMASVQIVANVGFLGAMLLSGFIYPVRNIVFPLSLASYLVPTMYYVLVARNEFVRGGSWFELWYAPVFFLVFDALLMTALFRMKMKLAG